MKLPSEGVFDGIILAAGKGSRMQSEAPKPLVQLKGIPLLAYILDAFVASGIPQPVVVVGHQGELVSNEMKGRARFAWQMERLGTAHATACALPHLDSQVKNILVFVGDAPLIRPATVRQLMAHHQDTGAACTFLSATFDIPLPYARVIRDDHGNLIRCVEERDAQPAELPVREYLSSHFAFGTDHLRKVLSQIQPHPRTGERYLTDAIQILLDQGERVEVCMTGDYRELVGLNTPEDLHWATQILESDGL